MMKNKMEDFCASRKTVQMVAMPLNYVPLNNISKSSVSLQLLPVFKLPFFDNLFIVITITI
jgi:hypothetical protein